METYYAGFIPYGGKVSVIFPDVPGCATWGETMEHAFVQSVEALAGHLEALVSDNDPVPTPSSYGVALEKLRVCYEELYLGPLPEGSLLHPVPAPDLDMRPEQVAVSFHKYMLEMIDRKADAAGMTRSDFLAAAAKAYEVEPI